MAFIHCIVLLASLYDSPATIPLMTMTVNLPRSLYDLMDSRLFDAKEIRAHSNSLDDEPIHS